MARAIFNREFKFQVVKQVIEEGKTSTNMANELELSPNVAACWVNHLC